MKVNNNIIFYSKSPTFKRTDADKLVASIPDEAIERLSIKTANSSVMNSSAQKIRKSMPGVTLGFLVAMSALFKKGKLSDKLVLGAAIGAGALVANKAIDLVSKVANKTTDENEDVANFKNEHPVLSTIGLVAISLAAATGAVKGISKITELGAKYAQKFFRPTVETFAAKAGNVLNNIDNSKASKFLENSVKPFAQKHSKLTNAVKSFYLPATLVGFVAADAALSSKMSNKFVDKYIKTKHDLYGLKSAARENLSHNA